MSKQTGTHITQHRPQKETKLTPTERALESQVKKLSRELLRVRKELSKVENKIVDNETAAEVEAETAPEPTVEPKCPNGCVELPRLLDLGFKTYLVCPKCLRREPVDKPPATE
jgi:hypothetical protein